MYSGESHIHKAGFTTSGQSRAQILTKLEEVLRNDHIQLYSDRLYNELKTFIWKGSKAQAQKGQNDDLVLALAIGVWLYDTSSGHNKQAVDLNAAMLKAFGVNRNTAEDSVLPSTEVFAHNPYKPQLLNAAEPTKANEGDPNLDLSWLLD